MSDPYYSNVSLLLHCNGTNGSTTFTDNSPSPLAVSGAGNAQISTAQSLYGGASLFLDGVGDFLAVPSSAALTFGTGDFTIECSVFISSFVNPQNWLLGNYIGGIDGYFGFYIDASGDNLAFRNGDSEVVSQVLSSNIGTDVWRHLAVTREGTTLRFFVDGVLQGAGSTFTSNLDGQGSCGLGSTAPSFPDDSEFHGYIDEIRVTKGVARYTASFTPPTGPYSDSGPNLISINWLTKVIYVPKAFMTEVSATLYDLDVNALRLALKDIEDSDGMTYVDTHRHNTQVVLSGTTYARTFEVINGYTVEFEDGSYTVRCSGANHNLADVKVINSVSLIIGNSAGLISVTSGSGLSTEQAETLALIAKLLKNKQITDPATGKLTVYDDDDTTILVQGDLYENVSGSQQYRGQGAERRDRLA
jgi:hypothetical protein